jgi:pimeloyl-ACP methyl ester carboxylesterase
VNKPQSLYRGDVALIGEEAGKGADILLLHAGGETRAVWRPIMTFLAESGFRSVAYDQRGHGESGGASSDGVIQYAADAKAMIASMCKPVVVGSSLGGFALMMALEELENAVAGLVLVDVVPAPDPERTRAYLQPRAGLGASPLVEDILSKSAYFTDIVGGLGLPILLACGGANSPLVDEDREHFKSLAPHANIEIIERASHLVARDAPMELSRLIADFANAACARN